ncbi:MAG: GDSL-type esterase/lipase family protein [Muribaculaceae bacterium]|nr:GDSL-type esterase/lipase family protein [Muribaculaceae bacterium]
MKRYFLLTIALAALTLSAAAQRSTEGYYGQRASLFDILPTSPDDIIFLGNSITDGAEWAELLGDPRAKNRGISGDRVKGVLERLDPIVEGKPAKIFLMIGVNDMAAGMPVDSIVDGVKKIVDTIERKSPGTKIYLESVLPVNAAFNRFDGHTSRFFMVPHINEGIRRIADDKKIPYIDLYSHFVDKATGKMKPEYTNDGLHLLGNGYIKWVEIIKPYL